MCQVCTDDSVLEELKTKKKENKDREEAKKTKAFESEQKKEREKRRKDKDRGNTRKKGRACEKETVEILSMLNPSDESGGSEAGVALGSKQKKEEMKKWRMEERINTQKKGNAHKNETVAELLSKMNRSDKRIRRF